MAGHGARYMNKPKRHVQVAFGGSSLEGGDCDLEAENA
jgi:hypothetical protein